MFRRHISLIVVGVGGWIGGSLHETYKNNSRTVFNATLPAKFAGSEVVPVEPPPTANRSTQIMRFGFPGFDNIRSLDDYVLSYDRRTRTAHWVFEHLTREKLANKELVDRNLSQFQEDQSFHHFFRATNNDYKSSGYDRGHLAAAGNYRVVQSHCDQTFLLSNISPQVGVGFNRGIWNKLEKYARYLTKTYKNVYVCTGPLYLPRREADGKLYVKYEVLGQNHVAVPTHFFKVIVSETTKNELDLEAYVLPNAPVEDSLQLPNFLVPLETIERAAGFLLFEKIPRNRFRTINRNMSSFR